MLYAYVISKSLHCTRRTTQRWKMTILQHTISRGLKKGRGKECNAFFIPSDLPNLGWSLISGN